MLIQILIILLILVILWRVIVKYRSKEIGLKELILWIIFWLIVAFVIARPEITSFLANIFGVGRGVDLVIYLSVIVLFYLFFHLTIRLRKMEANITKIVKKIALDNKQQTTDN